MNAQEVSRLSPQVQLGLAAAGVVPHCEARLAQPPHRRPDIGGARPGKGPDVGIYLVSLLRQLRSLLQPAKALVTTGEEGRPV